jgi:rhizoxin synthesis polyketide synthase/nonribosomal peptide synthetase RhiB
MNAAMKQFRRRVRPRVSRTKRYASPIASLRDIAVIGMACRVPGAATYGEFWDNLQAGCDSVREVPAARWDWRKILG